MLRLPARFQIGLSPHLLCIVLCERAWQDLSGSWETLLLACHTLRPRRTSELGLCSSSMLPSVGLKTSASVITFISWLNRMACRLAVYASRPGLPQDSRKTRFQVVAILTWTGLAPVGFHIKVSATLLPPLPGFPDAPIPKSRSMISYLPTAKYIDSLGRPSAVGATKP